MKLILSRKGFDSTSGGCPSPILPDGRLCSLPIPDASSPIQYGDIADADANLADLVVGLTGDQSRLHDHAHLDPDLKPESLARSPEWQPLFGQDNSAQGHLFKQGIAPGDLFLFFGLFRQSEWVDGRLRFVKAARPRHMLWGWMQIADILPLCDGVSDVPHWAKYHPHCHGNRGTNNTLYIAKRSLDGLSAKTPINGAGVFQFARPKLDLTDPQGKSVTHWKLPASFYPRGRPALTYHQRLDRWTIDGDYCQLKSVSRGQEFVLDMNEYPDVRSWAGQLISSEY